MNAPTHPLYTNEVSPEYLRRLDNSPFTEEQLAKFDGSLIGSGLTLTLIPLTLFTESPPKAVKPATAG